MVSKGSFVTNAINLRFYNLSESDKIVVLYSRERGLIRCVAKGVKKANSKLGARMDLFVANKLLLKEGKNFCTISQAEALNTFYKSRSDIDKIFYSMYVSEVVSNFGLEEDPSSSSVYDILYETLNSISSATTKVQILNSTIKFQLKMMQITGFSLELDKCLACGKPIEQEKMFFSQSLGGVICSNCNKHYKIQDIMHYKLRNYLSILANTEIDFTSEYEQLATEKLCSVCFNIIRNYIEFHSVKSFKSTKVLQEVS